MEAYVRRSAVFDRIFMNEHSYSQRKDEQTVK